MAKSGSGGAQRIVSLLASGTEIVSALGLGDRLVGISHECDYPTAVLDRPRLSRPRFAVEGLSSGEVDRAVRRAMEEHGSVYLVDGEALERLDPDLILTQAVCEVCAVPTPGVRDEVASRGMGARVVSLDAHRLEDVFGCIGLVGEVAGCIAASDALISDLRSRLGHVQEALAGAGRPRVLALEWLEPPFSPGHWVPEQIELAGGVNLTGDAGERSREVPWEALEGVDPDALVVMPCGYDLEASLTDAEAHAERLSRVAERAITEGRAWVVDGSSFFNRSGPRVVRGVEILAGLLHPERCPTPDAKEAAVWRPPA